MGLPFQVLNTSTTRKQKLTEPNPTIAELVLAKHPLSFKQSVLQRLMINFAYMIFLHEWPHVMRGSLQEGKKYAQVIPKRWER